jgi:hypothetical protein
MLHWRPCRPGKGDDSWWHLSSNQSPCSRSPVSAENIGKLESYPEDIVDSRIGSRVDEREQER